MNKVILTGNLANEPEYAQTQSGISRATFRLAVKRPYKNADGKRDADFLTVICWRGTADIIHKFVHKGDKLGIVGMIMTRSYQAQDGTKRYVTEIVADEVEMLGSRGGAGGVAGGAGGDLDEQQPEGFTAIDDDDELPF